MRWLDLLFNLFFIVFGFSLLSILNSLNCLNPFSQLLFLDHTCGKGQERALYCLLTLRNHKVCWSIALDYHPTWQVLDPQAKRISCLATVTVLVAIFLTIPTSTVHYCTNFALTSTTFSILKPSSFLLLTTAVFLAWLYRFYSKVILFRTKLEDT